MEVKLVVDGLEVEVGTKFLVELVRYAIPDTEVYSDLFSALAKSKNPYVRSGIASKDTIDEETAELLLADDDIVVLDAILLNDVAKLLVTNERLEEVLGFVGMDIASNIISNLNDYEEVDANALADFIIAKDNPALALELAEAYGTPKKILKKLVKSEDVDVKACAKDRLD